MSALQSRLDDTLSRADEILRDRLRREEAELERQNAERVDEIMRPLQRRGFHGKSKGFRRRTETLRVFRASAAI